MKKAKKDVKVVRVISKEKIDDIIPDGDVEAIKIVMDDGGVIYRHPVGGEIPVSTFDLDEFLLVYWLGRIRSISDAIGDEAYDAFGFVFDAIRQNAERQLEEIMTYVEMDIGHIKVDVVRHKAWPYREGRIIGIRFKPVKAKAAAA